MPRAIIMNAHLTEYIIFCVPLRCIMYYIYWVRNALSWYAPIAATSSGHRRTQIMNRKKGITFHDIDIIKYSLSGVTQHKRGMETSWWYITQKTYLHFHTIIVTKQMLEGGAHCVTQISTKYMIYLMRARNRIKLTLCNLHTSFCHFCRPQ